jgi:hypothetical protein
MYCSSTGRPFPVRLKSVADSGRCAALLAAPDDGLTAACVRSRT